jgi:hypothetical protein
MTNPNERLNTLAKFNLDFQVEFENRISPLRRLQEHFQAYVTLTDAEITQLQKENAELKQQLKNQQEKKTDG